MSSLWMTSPSRPTSSTSSRTTCATCSTALRRRFRFFRRQTCSGSAGGVTLLAHWRRTTPAIRVFNAEGEWGESVHERLRESTWYIQCAQCCEKNESTRVILGPRRIGSLIGGTTDPYANAAKFLYRRRTEEQHNFSSHTALCVQRFIRAGYPYNDGHLDTLLLDYANRRLGSVDNLAFLNRWTSQVEESESPIVTWRWITNAITCSGETRM